VRSASDAASAASRRARRSRSRASTNAPVSNCRASPRRASRVSTPTSPPARGRRDDDAIDATALEPRGTGRPARRARRVVSRPSAVRRVDNLATRFKNSIGKSDSEVGAVPRSFRRRSYGLGLQKKKKSNREKKKNLCRTRQFPVCQIVKKGSICPGFQSGKKVPPNGVSPRGQISFALLIFSKPSSEPDALAPKAITPPRALPQPKVRAHAPTRDRRDASFAGSRRARRGDDLSPTRVPAAVFGVAREKVLPSRSLNRRDAGSTPTRPRAARSPEPRPRKRAIARVRTREPLPPVPNPARLAVPPERSG